MIVVRTIESPRICNETQRMPDIILDKFAAASHCGDEDRAAFLRSRHNRNCSRHHHCFPKEIIQFGLESMIAEVAG